MAQREAEIAQLKDALARRQQIGVATGLLAQRFAHHPERAWSLLVRLSQNCHFKVRNIAQAIINAPCGRLSPADIEILSAIECICPMVAALRYVNEACMTFRRHGQRHHAG